MRPRIGDLIITEIASVALRGRVIHGLGVVMSLYGPVEWTDPMSVSCYYVKSDRMIFGHLIYHHEIARVIR